MTSAQPEPAPTPLTQPRSPTDLFVTFTLLALQGFGGVLAIAQRELCERKRWLTPAQFLEVLSLGQVLPGPNVCNLSLIIGDRFFGWRGAFAALAGMMTAPLVIVLALTALFAQVAHHPMVAGALHGMGAVVAGLIAGTALKLAAPLRNSPLQPAGCAVLGMAAFGLIAWLRLPLAWVLLGLGPLAVAWAWRVLAPTGASRT